jgi:hypothetical protein
VTWWQYALWGAFGGFAVELTQFYGAVRRNGDWPWKDPNEPSAGPFLASVVVRVGLGMGLAVAAGESGQVAGAFGVIAVGVAAPLIVERMTSQIPVEPPAPARAPSAQPAIEEASDAR